MRNGGWRVKLHRVHFPKCSVLDVGIEHFGPQIQVRCGMVYTHIFNVWGLKASVQVNISADLFLNLKTDPGVAIRSSGTKLSKISLKTLFESHELLVFSADIVIDSSSAFYLQQHPSAPPKYVPSTFPQRRQTNNIEVVSTGSCRKVHQTCIMCMIYGQHFTIRIQTLCKHNIKPCNPTCIQIYARHFWYVIIIWYA